MLTDALHSDAPGGSRRVVQELAGGLVARGNRVTLVAPRQRGDEPPCRDQDGIRVYRYGNGGKGMRALPKLLTEERQALTALVRDAAGYPFDILNVHFSYFHLPALLPFSSRLAPVTVRSFYGPWAAEGLVEQAPRRARDPRSAGAWARFKARSSIEQRSLDRSDHIIALSDHSIRELTDLYNVPREKISLVPGGVDYRQFTPPTVPKADLRRQLGLPIDGQMILTVRRLAARMGIGNLIAAMPDVLRALPVKPHLVIVGQGRMREELERQVADLGLEQWVHFAGFVPDADLPLYYQAADLFALPTRSLEGFGLITLEAFASGLPVVGTPVGATPELLSQIDERLILRDTSAGAIAEGIVRYFTDVQKELAPRSLRELVLSTYTWATVVAQTETVYEHALAATDQCRQRRPYPSADVA